MAEKLGPPTQRPPPTIASQIVLTTITVIQATITVASTRLLAVSSGPLKGMDLAASSASQQEADAERKQDHQNSRIAKRRHHDRQPDCPTRQDHPEQQEPRQLVPDHGSPTAEVRRTQDQAERGDGDCEGGRDDWPGDSEHLDSIRRAASSGNPLVGEARWLRIETIASW